MRCLQGIELFMKNNFFTNLHDNLYFIKINVISLFTNHILVITHQLT